MKPLSQAQKIEHAEVDEGRTPLWFLGPSEERISTQATTAGGHQTPWGMSMVYG